MPPECLPEFAPLQVPAFGRTWQVTAWFEPLWRTGGRLFALEMLTRIRDPQTGRALAPEQFFAHLPGCHLRSVMDWQLRHLFLLLPWCEARQVKVSLNITRTMGMMTDASALLCGSIERLAPHLRLEINEHFFNPDRPPEEDALLRRLGELAPLWLDDFGCGSTGLALLLGGHFNAVKLDKSLTSSLSALPEGVDFLHAFACMSNGLGTALIAEGVENDAFMAFAAEAGMTACQGSRWPGTSYAGLATLAQVLPAAPPSPDTPDAFK